MNDKIKDQVYEAVLDMVRAQRRLRELLDKPIELPSEPAAPRARFKQAPGMYTQALGPQEGLVEGPQVPSRVLAIKHRPPQPFVPTPTEPQTMTLRERVEGRATATRVAEEIVDLIPMARMSKDLRLAFRYWAAKLVGVRLKGQTSWKKMPSGHDWTPQRLDLVRREVFEYMEKRDWNIPSSYLSKVSSVASK